MSQKRLFLLDAYALIFRGYYAFIKNPRINSKGMDTSAIMGFMNSLMDVIKREKPDHWWHERQHRTGRCARHRKRRFQGGERDRRRHQRHRCD